MGRARHDPLPSVTAGGLPSASLVVPGSTPVVGLFTATLSSMTFAVSTGTWTATVHTSTGAMATLTVAIRYDNIGALTAGSLRIGRVDIAGVLTLAKTELNYDTTKSAWTGSSGVIGGTSVATVSLTVADVTGAVSAGSIDVGAESLFGALPLGSLTSTYGSSQWQMESTSPEAGGGTVSATFPVTATGITGETISQDGSPINLYTQLPANSAALDYAVTAGLPVYSGALTVALPGAGDSATPATFAVNHDQSAKVRVALTSDSALFGGVTLTSLAAPVKGATKKTGTSVCGPASMDLGPQVGTGSSQIATLKGGLSFVYPKTGGVLYQLEGSLAVPAHNSAKAALGVAVLGLLEGQPTASVKLALGTAKGTGICPLKALPTPTTLTLAKGIRVKGTLTGAEGDAVFFLKGPASFSYPLATLLPASATVRVLDDVGRCVHVVHDRKLRAAHDFDRLSRRPAATPSGIPPARIRRLPHSP